MTLSSYNINTQYQRTELSYEAKISPISSEDLKENKRNKENNQLESPLIPVIYTNESDLSNMEQVRKQIFEKILGGFSMDKGADSLLPNNNIKVDNNSYEKNPYSVNNNVPSGLYYSSSTEYYEKTSIEFSAQARIKTPNGEYNIELKFSFTQEFYEKNETEIKVANENFKNPFDIELDRDDESLKDLKYLHIIFASYKNEKDEKFDIFEQLRELLTQRDKTVLETIKNDEKNDKALEKKLDNFKMWQETSNHEISLVAIKKDGLGVFLANSSSESSG